MRQVVQFDFSGGLDQQTDARHVQPGQLTALTNGQFDKIGSIRKRAGTTGLSRSTTAGGTITSGKHLATLGDELVEFDGSSVYSYSPGAAKWVLRDDASPFGVLPRETIVQSAVLTRTTATIAAQDNVTPDVAYVNGYYLVTYLAQSQYSLAATVAGFGMPRYVLVDATTGAHVQAGNIETGVTFMAPRLTVIGVAVYLVYADNAGKIWGRQYDTSTLTLGSAVQLAADAFVGNTVDVAITATDRLFVVYRNNSAAAPFVSYTVRSAVAALTLLGSGTVASAAPIVAATFVRLSTVATAGETWWIGYSYTVAGSAYGFAVGHSPTLFTQTVAPTQVVNATGTTGDAFSSSIVRVSATVAMLAGSWTNAKTGHNVTATYFGQVNTSAATVGPQRIVPNAVLASKLFTSGGRFYAWFCTYSGQTPDSLQPTLVCADLKYDDIVSAQIATRPVAMTAPRIASAKSGLTTTGEFGSVYGSFVPSVCVNGTSLVTAAITKPGATMARAVDLVTLTTAPKRVTAELGRTLFSSGGFVGAFDGERFFESVFLTYPEAPQGITTLNGSGSLPNNGVYKYVLVATAYNAHGEVMQSSPSVPTGVTLGAADNTVRFWAQMLPFTAITKTDPSLGIYVVLELYRTKNGGTVYYRVPEAKIWDVSTTQSGPIIDDPYTSVWERQYEDRAADSDLDGQPILYTNGGILSNVAPPGSEIIAVHQDRLFVADGKDVWFSSKLSTKTNGVMPRFNELQRFTVEDGGNITAMASCGAFLAIFKRDRIFVVGGDGPDLDGGTGQEFTPPARVSSDVGCIEPRSVAVTPNGTVFQAVAGIYLLSPGGQVQYLSGPVQDALDTYSTITAATVHETEFQVRFATTETTGQNGLALVWDYFPIAQAPGGRWSTFDYYDVVADTNQSAICGAVNSRGVYHWVAPGGTVYKETPGTYLDNGSRWVTLSFETAWFKFAGLQGFQRVWSVALLGERFTDHDLTFKYATDYSAAYSTAVNKTIQSTFGLEQLEFTPRTQKCEAMRVFFTDATPSLGTVGTGRALSFTGLAFEVKLLPKINRLASTKRA